MYNTFIVIVCTTVDPSPKALEEMVRAKGDETPQDWGDGHSCYLQVDGDTTVWPPLY